MENDKEFQETMSAIATLGTAAEQMLVNELMLNGATAQEAQEQAMNMAPEIYQMMNAANDPVWTHVHACIGGLSQYLRQSQTNEESVAAYASAEYMKFDRQSGEAAQDLIGRARKLLEPLYNNAERYPADVEAVERITGNAGALAQKP